VEFRGQLIERQEKFKNTYFNFYVDNKNKRFMDRKQINLYFNPNKRYGYSVYKHNKNQEFLNKNNCSKFKIRGKSNWLYNREGIYHLLANTLQYQDKAIKLLKFLGFSKRLINMNKGFGGIRNRYTINNNIAKIRLNHKNDTLYTLIDEEDLILFKNIKRTVSAHRRAGSKTNIYAEMSIGKNYKTVPIHQIILGLSGGREKVADHLNGDSLDNRKSNLRISTNLGNARNSKIRSDNKSGVKGVHYDKRKEKWIARISLKGERILLGNFENKKDAILARREAELKYWEKEDIRRLNL
jgi:hypothetical protein